MGFDEYADLTESDGMLDAHKRDNVTKHIEEKKMNI